MKKTIFMIAAVAFMSLGCTKENIDDKASQPEQKVITFSAGDENVKSVLDGKSVKWAKDDHIAIYDGKTFDNGSTMRYNAHMFAYSSDYKFTYAATQQYSSNGTIDLNQEGAFYAVYPCLNDSEKNSDVFKLTEGGATITTFLASRQMPKPNTFATAANISACIPTVNAEEGELQGVMKNLCGYIKFSIESAENIAYVKFTSNSNGKMSGKCDVVFDGEDIYLDGDENYFVFCSSESGGPMAKGTYYVAVIPRTHANGINIMLTTTDGKVYEYNTGKNITIEAGIPYNFGALDSKMPSGLTDKASILMNFVSDNTNIADAGDANYDSVFELVVGDYTIPVTHLYSRDGYAIWNRTADAYVKTPAIEGMSLKNVVVTFRGHTKNSAAQLRLYTIDDLTLSGQYKLVKNPTGATDSQYALPTMNAKYNLRMSHVFIPGTKNTPGEHLGTLNAESLGVNTSCYLKMDGGVCLIESIELLYEPAQAE